VNLLGQVPLIIFAYFSFPHLVKILQGNGTNPQRKGDAKSIIQITKMIELIELRSS
jgi:hypothetical protein